SRDVLYRHLGVDAVLVIEIDVNGAQSPERPLERRADVLRPAVDPRLPAVFEMEAELGGDDHTVTQRLQRFAQQLFVGKRPVDLRRIEEGDAALDGRADERNRLPLLGEGRKGL